MRGLCCPMSQRKGSQHQIFFLYLPQPSISNICLPEEELRGHFLKKFMHTHTSLRKLWLCQNNFSSRKGVSSKPPLVWRPELLEETMVILSLLASPAGKCRGSPTVHWHKTKVVQEKYFSWPHLSLVFLWIVGHAEISESFLTSGPKSRACPWMVPRHPIAEAQETLTEVIVFPGTLQVLTFQEHLENHCFTSMWSQSCCQTGGPCIILPSVMF